MYNINRIHEIHPPHLLLIPALQTWGGQSVTVSFLFIPPFFIRRGAMPRHMPRTAHEPRGVNKIHGLVVAVETEQLNRRFLFTILYLAAGKQRQIVVGIASLSLSFCPGNRATCPCSSVVQSRSDGQGAGSIPAKGETNLWQ